MWAEKIAGKVGIGANLIYMLHKPCNFYYEFLIWTKAMKGVRNVFRIYLKLTLFHFSLTKLNHVTEYFFPELYIYIYSSIVGP